MAEEPTTLPKDDFFDAQRALGLALSYDDVLLKTGESAVMPAKVCTETRFAEGVVLKVPIVSAAMDTVTEHRMAIAMALSGGIGVIHKNLTVREQAREVYRVKNFLHGFIEHPVTVSPDETVGDVLAMREARGLPFHTFPVVRKSGKVVGMIAGATFRSVRTSARRCAPL